MAKQDISVRQLVDKVLSGELALPEMQRRYVWTTIKVRDLLDSLYRGYPSGAILVWEGDPNLEDRSLQIQGIKENQLSNKLLLLDGQQRLTSLTAILSGKPVSVRNKKKPIDIMFNLNHPDTIVEESTELDEEEDEDDDDDDNGNESESDIMEELRKRTFVVASRSLKNDPTWISVSEVFIRTESQLLKPLGINSDDPNWEKYAERIKKLKKIEDYPYVMQILDKKLSYEEVTEIFVRVNSLGAKLRGSDLALAQITSKWKGFITEIDKFAKEFDNNEDYLLDSGILVKTLVAFATNQSKFKTVNRVPIENFKEAWKKTQHGLRFAINLLKNNARIENLRLLGSPFLLVPISYYAILKNEKLTKEEEKKLMFWFYVAHMKGRYGLGSSEGLLDSDISALYRTKNLDELLSILKLQVKDFYASVDEIKGKNRRSPYFSMLFIVSKQQGIKDWFTGMAISERLIGRAHALQFHHIFPKSLLKKQGADRKEINEIANMAFIGGKTNRNISNKEPEQYLIDVVEKRGEDILDHHMLPSNRNLWKLNKYNDFLTHRREKLVESINEFLKKFAW
jgi:hypothetical protein